MGYSPYMCLRRLQFYVDNSLSSVSLYSSLGKAHVDQRLIHGGSETTYLMK